MDTELTLPDLVPFNRRDHYRDRVIATFICLGLTGIVGLLAADLGRRGVTDFYAAEVLTGEYNWEYRPAAARGTPISPAVANPIEADVATATLDVDAGLQPYTGYLSRLVLGGTGAESATTHAANGARVSSATFIRSGPSRNNASVGTIPAGTSVNILETHGAWHRVETAMVTGWVWEGMLSDISVAPVIDMPRTAQGSLADLRGRVSRQIGLRAEPAGDIIKVLPVLTEVTVSNHGEANAEWLPVTVDGTEGWVYRGLVRLSAR